MRRFWPAVALTLFSVKGIAAEQAYGMAWTLALVEARKAACEVAIQPNMEQFRQAIRTNNQAEANKAVLEAVAKCMAIGNAPIR